MALGRPPRTRKIPLLRMGSLDVLAAMKNDGWTVTRMANGTGAVNIPCKGWSGGTFGFMTAKSLAALEALLALPANRKLRKQIS